ncbi:MAG TPA: GWxTD domain-containing protein [Acidobacteriota bacterium]|nr:GWxTD domain-containing protein [Acidobacteriota bacterium]
MTRRYARFEGGLFLATLVVFLALPLRADAADPPRAQVGNASRGDLRFHARAVPFRHEANQGRAEFSIRVPYDQMKFLPVDSVYEAKLRLTVELKNRAGKSIAKRREEARVQITELGVATDSLLGEIYTVGLAAPQGVYRFKVLVEDLSVPRRGLVYSMKNEKRQGTVEGEVDLGAWLFQSPAMSGVLPAWTISTDVEVPRFAKGPYEVLPQPSGAYGLYQDVCSAYYEIYDTPPPPEGRSYRLTSHLIGTAGDTVFTSLDSLRVTEGSAWPHAVAVDVSRLAAGHYRLWFGLESSDAGSRATSTATEIDILWTAASWAPFASDIYEVEARVLLSAEEALAFESLPLGTKEARLQELWRSVDPTPETAENEAYLEFRRRVRHANVNYTVFQRGMFSDRGRIYIRYGEPDEIRMERLPVNDNTLSRSLGGEIPTESERRLTKRESGVVDERPFEVWTYHLRGQEIVPRRGLSETGSSLKFVFVDDQGYGEYILRYSSTLGTR